MKSCQTIIRKHHMEQLYYTAQLIGMKDKNISLDNIFQHETHIETLATLDYAPKLCQSSQGNQIKYDFHKLLKIPFLDINGFLTRIKLKKHRFQAQSCRKVTLAETSLGQKTTKSLTLFD